MSSSIKVIGYTLMVDRWFGVGQFLSGAIGQLYPGGDTREEGRLLMLF